jgi:uncharacterized membrane protein
MTVGLIPFSTALLTQYKSEQLSIFVYAFNSILAGLIVFALYHHAKDNPELIDKTVHILIRKRSGRRLAISLLTYLIAIIFAFIYLPISHLLFLLVLLPEFIPDRFLAREKFSAYDKSNETGEKN